MWRILHDCAGGPCFGGAFLMSVRHYLVISDCLPPPFTHCTGQALRRASLKKPVTASTITTTIAPAGASTVPRRASLYRASPSGFKTFSFVKEASFLENVRFMCYYSCLFI